MAKPPGAAARHVGTVGGVLLRLTLLYTGLVIFGFAIQTMVIADLGVPPWDVFHTGLADRLDWSLGVTTVMVSFVVLLSWIFLRERPGLGTVSNAVLVGTFVDVAARLLPSETPDSMALRIAMLVTAVSVNGVATGMYIGARFGPGPRDGLMTGLVRITGHKVAVVRTSIEVSVLAIGFVLGGTVGLGTVLYALSIGPLLQWMLPAFTIPQPEPVPA